MTGQLDADFEALVVGGAPDPRPFYAELRERAPVYRTPFDFWYVTRYDIANAVMRGDAAWSVAATSDASHDAHHDRFAFQVMSQMLLTMDGADHARLRRLVGTIFTGRAAERLRGKVDDSVRRSLDSLSHRTEVDLFGDFAQMLPTEVILDVLGIGHEHAPAAVAVADSLIAMHEPAASEATLQAADEAFRAVADLVVSVAAERRVEPRDDLLTALVQAADGSDALGDDELVAMVTILIVAGHETTANTLCTGVLHLLEHDALGRLRENPSLVPSAVEELLRYDAATRNSVGRYALEDIELPGATIRKGDKLFVSLHAANHDPAEFPDPLSLDLARKPNRHIGFGGGAHYCLGAAVARMELQVVLAALLERSADIQLAGEPTWRPSFIIRGLTSLAVRLEPAEV